jgi:hypothetical protein
MNYQKKMSMYQYTISRNTDYNINNKKKDSGINI